VAKIDRWYAEQFAKFCARWTPPRTSTSLVVAQFADHLRSGNADGNRHTHDNLPVVLRRRRRRLLSPGRFVQHGSNR